MRISQKHHKPVNTEANTGSRRHTDFYCPDKIFIQRVRFFFASAAAFDLLFEQLALQNGVVQLGI
jgi:hypothetical protein